MKNSISIVSDTNTSVFKREFSGLDECNLGAIYGTLYSNIDSDYLVLLLSSKFYEDLDIKQFTKALQSFRQDNSAIILLSNSYKRLDDYNSTNNIKKYQKLLDLNSKLEKISYEISDIVILNLFDISYKIGIDNFINLKNSYLFQSPFTKDGIKAISKEIRAKIEITTIPKAKLICIDGDNTLWGGIIGEDGIGGVECDENYPGIVYKQFQEQLLELKANGILLALISKNNHDDIIELFKSKNMPLKLDDFISIKINWQPKSNNIQEVADELNIGIDSILFIDDSDFEIGEVSNALGVDTIQVSKEDLISNLELLNHPRLYSLQLTKEDKNKTLVYKQQQLREAQFSKSNSLEEYIKSLNISLTYNINNHNNLSRITQLINKTNQFNLTTKRYTQTQVHNLMKNNKVYDFTLSDRFGDMGIVGVVIVVDDEIDTFLLSCRALGRGVEKMMLEIVSYKGLKASYVPSEKNSQVQDFYSDNGYNIIEANYYICPF
jgi:FkbH-like protein